MRCVLLRMGEVDPIGIGIVKVPQHASIRCIHHNETGPVFLDDISEAEYTSYEYLDLFPEFNWVQERPGGAVLVYDPIFYYSTWEGWPTERQCVKRLTRSLFLV